MKSKLVSNLPGALTQWRPLLLKNGVMSRRGGGIEMDRLSFCAKTGWGGTGIEWDLLIALTWVLRRSKQKCVPWLLPLRGCVLKLTGTQAEVRVEMLSILFQITLESSGTSFGR